MTACPALLMTYTLSAVLCHISHRWTITLQVFESLSTIPYQYDAVCEGADFFANARMWEIDLAVMHVFPDKWMACSEACKLDWTTKWLTAHLRDAVRLQKPLLIAEFGALRPHAWRYKVMKLVYNSMTAASNRQHPMAGEQVEHWNTCSCVCMIEITPDCNWLLQPSDSNGN